MTTNFTPGAASGTVVATGPVTGQGTFTQTPGDVFEIIVDLPEGSLFLLFEDTSRAVDNNERGCVVQFSGTGTVVVTGGTGAFSGASGSGSLLARPHGVSEERRWRLQLRRCPEGVHHGERRAQPDLARLLVPDLCHGRIKEFRAGEAATVRGIRSSGGVVKGALLRSVGALRAGRSGLAQGPGSALSRGQRAGGRTRCRGRAPRPGGLDAMCRSRPRRGRRAATWSSW
jgi:hypothetical protein